jgi:hypothetical protein
MLKESYDTEPTERDLWVFEKLIPPDHSLRRVKQLRDFARFRDVVTDGYSPTMGRTADDPVRRITLGCLQFHAHLSDREVIAAAQVHVAFRDFLALSLARRVPGPSWLTPCRTRLGAQRSPALFDQLVTPAREAGVLRDRRRRTDATPSMAHSAVPSPLEVVAQTRQRLVEAARPYAPAPVTADEAEAEVGRPATADLPETARLVARVTPLRPIVAWAEGVQEALGPVPAAPDQARPRFEAALALAPRVLADRDEPDPGDPGRRGVDPDARRGQPGASGDGALLEGSLEADRARLTALNGLPGNGDEARETPARWAAAARAQGQAVEAVSIDGMGWHGEVVRALRAPEGLGVEVDVPPPPGPEETSIASSALQKVCQRDAAMVQTLQRLGV